MKPTTIVWATDGSDLADRALDTIRDFAPNWATRPRVVAVHIDQRWSGREMNVPKLAGEVELEAKIREQLRALESEGFATGFELRHAHRMEDEARLIAAVAAEIEAQLIVVGTRGLGRMAGALLGSVAQGLMRNAPCPVLVVPPVAAAQARVEEVERERELTPA